MKPVVILNLISSALSGKGTRHRLENEQDRPLSAEGARREIVYAITAIVIAFALILAVVLSFFWEPDL
jgi:hypothetical protein